MVPKGKGDKSVLGCSCGYKSSETNVKLTEEVKSKKDKIEVVGQESETLPKTEAECPKCGNETAYYWTQQTRAADEGETKFLKCAKCEHTWREYG